jgi:two-component system, OmpR family, response regulator QseB
VQRVLVVEDERELAAMLDRLLSSVGYQVDVVHDGQAGLHRVLTDRYDALVLDRGLPAIDGLDLLRRLRRSGVTTPVLLLTAYDSVPDRVEGLDAGAQDHLGKPFDVDELLARLRSLLRRAGPDEAAELLDLGTRRLDLAARLVVDDGPGQPPVSLSEREADLLEVLARRPTRVFSREELRDRIFDSAESEAVVETYVSYLRRKLGPEAVRTVRGVGYRMGSV